MDVCRMQASRKGDERMIYVEIDVHKRKCNSAIMDEQGRILDEILTPIYHVCGTSTYWLIAFLHLVCVVGGDACYLFDASRHCRGSSHHVRVVWLHSVLRGFNLRQIVAAQLP